MKTNTPAIAMSPVKSGQIESIGYLGGTLAVKFRHGGEYHYHDVPQDTFNAMQKSESIGSFLHANVKSKFKFTKQGENK